MSTPAIRHIHLPEIDSTNKYARAILSETPITLISTDYQTAGRGQRGNSWESQAGKNLLFTLSVSPVGIPATQQFAVCELISIAICDILKSYTEDIHIKWPNDIYYQDRKLCGILIEHDVEGSHLLRTIIGVGLNVNQTHFASDAPNPVSLHQILGHEVERESLLHAIAEHFSELFKQYSSSMLDRNAMHNRYTSLLYRRGIPSTYKDAQGEFIATLRDVRPDGSLILEDQQGTLHSYLFKEVSYII